MANKPEQLTDLRALILCEIGDFFAGFGCPGEPKTPEDMQRELTMRVGRILNDHIVNYPRCEALVEILRECRIARDEAQAELQERRKADNAEPVYQIKGERGGEWHDFSKLSFDEFVSFGGEGRILYTAHPVPVLPLSITLPDTSSKAFWSGTGKKEIFQPETYKRWAKEAIERFCMIAGIAVEVK